MVTGGLGFRMRRKLAPTGQVREGVASGVLFSFFFELSY